MRAWLGAFGVYRRPRLVAVLLMGFSSGLPLPLTLGTLSYWLAELGVSLTTIGLFTLVGLPYSFKFLWSPIDGSAAAAGRDDALGPPARLAPFGAGAAWHRDPGARAERSAQRRPP